MKIDQFLQSNDWASFQDSLGHEVIRFGDFFAFKKNMRLGFSQLYVPRIAVNGIILGLIEKTAKELNVDFVRLEPLNDAGLMKENNYLKVKDHNPSRTIVIDLLKDENYLKKELHSKTRYNIGLAQKKGVKYLWGGTQGFDDFWRLISSTYSRKNLKTLSKEYYQKFLQYNKGAYLSFAEYQGKKIVANLMLEYGNTLTYVHGGSDKRFQKLMGAHLLQWQEIIQAKQRGLRYYDFWGIAPDDDPNHPWSGITRFKKGFGGMVVQWPGTFEKAINLKRYRLYKFLTKMRKL